tara:strand:+ start:315 stop:476 length:162 start_codon:yes stop_codon:yes gene_type:complete
MMMDSVCSTWMPSSSTSIIWGADSSFYSSDSGTPAALAAAACSILILFLDSIA